MKKIIVLLLLCYPLVTLAQDASYDIEGRVGKLNAPAKIFLTYRFDGRTLADSAILKNGKFRFKGKTQKASQGRLALDRENRGLMAALRGTDVLFFFMDKKVSINTVDSIKNAKVTGSALNKEHAAYLKTLSGPQAILDDLSKQWTGASKEQQNDKAFIRSSQAQLRPAREELLRLQKVYIKEHPASYISLSVLREIAGSRIDLKVIEPLFNDLTPELKGTILGKSLAEQMESTKLTVVGAKAMDFTQNDVNDKPVKLSDFRGKYVLLDFWASWCGPCRAENPNLVAAYHKFKDKNFTVLGVSLDNPGKKADWLKAIEKDKLDWTQVSDLQGWKNAVSVLYGVAAVPQNYLIGPDGTILASNLRGEALHKKLEELLSK